MTSFLDCSPTLSFDLPDSHVAAAPPEARGVARDAVRMLVAANPDDLRHAHVFDLPDTLQPGDVLVLNTSQTLPAALIGHTAADEPLAIHLSTVLPGPDASPAAALVSTSGRWVVELREPTPTGTSPSHVDRTGTRIRLSAGADLAVLAAYPAGASSSRLRVAQLSTPTRLFEWLAEWGEPIRYPYVHGRWPLTAYQTTFGDTPGSAEMPSAGRPLTAALLERLRRRGVELARLVLHCGVSSLEAGEPPYAEWYSVPPSTARRLARARHERRRVIAVGTTVVRALESAALATGEVVAGAGWTDLVVTPEGGVRSIDGLLTGWHEPAASHLQLLEAVAGRDLLCASYRAALEHGYRWHEFGDLHLILPR